MRTGGEFTLSKECTLSAICWQQFYDDATPDVWIGAMFGPPADNTTSPSMTAQRLSEDVSRSMSVGLHCMLTACTKHQLYNTLVASGNSVASQQSFIDAYYGLLSTSNGPWPE